MKNVTIDFLLSRTSSNYEDIQCTGIYKIFHTHNPEIIYIGSATSSRKWRSGFKQRWINHIKDLKRNSHSSTFLQNVVNKYGIEGLRFEIIEKCSSEECLKREQYWLDLIEPFGSKGYNTCRIAGNTLGYRFLEHQKSKRKSIIQYSLNGEFIKQWESLNAASRELKINVSSIKDCCKKRFNQIKGYIFRYSEDTDVPKEYIIKEPMLIECFYKNDLIYVGRFSEIACKVPDRKHAIYNSLRSGKPTKKGWAYKKQINQQL